MDKYLRKNNEKIEQRTANITYTQAGEVLRINIFAKFEVRFFD